MEYQSQSPYFDDYDPKKGYVQVVAIGNRVAQAREFTQIQSINLDYLSRLGNAVLKNGAIIDGCNPIIKGTTVYIESGTIFLDGLVRIIYGTDEVIDGNTVNVGGSVTITGSGTERIGARIITSIVTEAEDSSLKDPAVATLNYGKPGAHRVKQELEFVVNGDDAATLFTLVDGELQNSQSTVDTTSQITDTLARRTYDENGNYKIYGLSLRADADELKLNVTNGKAYIRGYEVLKSTNSKLSLDSIDETQEVTAEPKYFLGTGSNHQLKLNYYPLAKVVKVIAQVRVIDEQVTRSYPAGGRDNLKNDAVIRILSVYSTTGSSGTLYTEGLDYKLSDDDIDWSLNTSLNGTASKEPAIGSSYYVSYLYNKELVEGTDFEIVNSVDSNGDGVQYIKFISSSENSNSISDSIYPSYVNITYNVSLSRRDLIMLDKDGNFVIYKSQPDRQSFLITPYNMDDANLDLGYVDIVPYLDSTDNYNLKHQLIVTNYKTERLTQSQLYNLSRRIDDLEYNQAIQDLDSEAAEGESATSLKGVFTDGFIGTTKCDLGYNKDGVAFNACIDYDMEELTIPAETLANTLKIQDSNLGEIGRVLSAPFTNKLTMSQKYATDKELVNPYSVFNPLAIVELNPTVDNWIDTKTIYVENNVTNTATDTSYATFSHGWWSTNAVYNLRNYLRTTTTTKNQGTTTASSTSVSNTVKDTMIEYMRQITVTVHGTNFTPDQDNIKCKFNDIDVALTPVNGSSKGTDSGSVRSNDNGEFYATFKIPAKVPCGVVAVKLYDSVDNGQAEFSAEGTLRTTTVTTTNTTTLTNHVLVERHNLYGSDPLAQSFRFNEDTVITQVGLYFAAKATKKAVVVQVREMINGYPGSTVYAAVTLRPDQIKTSEDSSAETIVTFDQPVYCKADTYYCFTILSDSNAYEMYYCKLGGTDILTKEVVTANPNSGVMFTSSNANTWNASQDCDLKFNLYEAYYTGSGSILFESVSAENMNRLILAAEYIDYKNAGITWSYRYLKSDGVTWSQWFALDTYNLRSLDEVANGVQLKAELSVAYNTSPFIADDCINLISFIDSKEATYVSREIYLDEDYTKLKIACQFYAPTDSAACGFRVYYMDDQKTWTQLTSDPTVSKINDEFNEYVWELDSIHATKSKTYRVRIDMYTNNVFYRPRAHKLRSILKY